MFVLVSYLFSLCGEGNVGNMCMDMDIDGMASSIIGHVLSSSQNQWSSVCLGNPQILRAHKQTVKYTMKNQLKRANKSPPATNLEIHFKLQHIRL